jgi:hypothetical protein
LPVGQSEQEVAGDMAYWPSWHTLHLAALYEALYWPCGHGEQYSPKRRAPPSPSPLSNATASSKLP